MKNLCILFAIGLVVFVYAQDNALKTEHEKLLQENGDIQFYQGNHNFTYQQNQLISSYSLKKAISLFYAQNGRKFYRIVLSNFYNDKLTLSFNDRISFQGQTHTFPYSISFDLGKNKQSCQVSLDSQLAIANKQKVISCIFKYGLELLEVLKGCPKDNIIQCVLSLIEPGHKLYKCIYGENLFPNNGISATNIFGGGSTTATSITKILSMSKHNTKVYLDFEQPILKIDRIKVLSGLGGVAFHQITPVPNILYIGGAVYNKPGHVTVSIKATVAPNKVPKKKIVFMTKHASFHFKGKTEATVDFGAPVARIDHIKVLSGFGAVGTRQIFGNQVYVSGGVYAKPGHFSFAIHAAVYK